MPTTTPADPVTTTETPPTLAQLYDLDDAISDTRHELTILKTQHNGTKARIATATARGRKPTQTDVDYLEDNGHERARLRAELAGLTTRLRRTLSRYPELAAAAAPGLRNNEPAESDKDD